MPHPAPPSPIQDTAGQDSTHPVSTHHLRQVATQTLNRHPPISRNAPIAIRAAKHRKTTQDQAHTHTQTLHPTHPGNTQVTPRQHPHAYLYAYLYAQDKNSKNTKQEEQETHAKEPTGRAPDDNTPTHEPTSPRAHELNTPTNKTPQQDQHTTTHQEENKRTKEQNTQKSTHTTGQQNTKSNAYKNRGRG